MKEVTFTVRLATEDECRDYKKEIDWVYDGPIYLVSSDNMQILVTNNTRFSQLIKAYKERNGEM